jgi:serine/threonine-protein kinase
MSEDVFGIVGTTQAGVFRVERVVAEGGFAVVYRAYHEGFRAPVALKCLKVPDAMSDAQRDAFLEKFRTEGELLFQLSSLVPAVVRPLHIDVLELGERIVPFLALEWLDGEALDQIVDKRQAQGKPPLGIRTLVPFLQPAAQALAQAHQVPTPEGAIAIIHRDIKPDNIFVAKGPDGEVVKILDFGIARTRSAAQLDAGAMTATSALDAFTPGYAAPEQWMPKRFGQIGPWTDVFCLALTMVDALIGRPAIEGDVSKMAQQTIDLARRPTPRTMGAVVPDEVERAFAKALAVDPRERTRSIGAFWTELENALGLPPSIKLGDPAARARSLTEASEPPPPMPSARAAGSERIPTDPRVRPAGGERIPTDPRVRPAGGERIPTDPRVRPPQDDVPPGARGGAPTVPFDVGVQAVRPGRPPTPGQLAPRLAQKREAVASKGSLSKRGLADLRAKLRIPVSLVAIAAVMSLADTAYGKITGELFTLGGVRPLWISGPLALIGVALACWRIFGAL